jgi:hypothetical protein
MPLCRTLRTAAAAVGLVWLALAARPAVAGEPAPILTVKSATVGVGGRYKAGYWTPIWLDLQAGPEGARGQLETVTPDGDNVPVIYGDDSAGVIDLAAGQEQRLLRYAKTGPAAATIRVQLRTAGERGEQVVWSHELSGLPAPLAATQELVVGIGPALDLPSVVATIKRPAELALAAVQVNDPANLPDRWWGYEGVDTVVLTTSDSAAIGGLTAEQQAALIEWVQLGGRLVLSIGSRGGELLASGPWSAVVPGQFVEVTPLREPTGLEAFVGAEVPWEDDEFQRNRPQVSRLDNIDGIVLVDEIGGASQRPLIVRSPFGLGEVVFVGLDLDHPGLAKWAGRPRLVAALLAGGDSRGEQDQPEARRSVTHLGYEDLVGQLRAALDQFHGVALVNFTTVSVLTVAYLLLIGPGDYLLLSRLNLPRHLTWITFTLVAIAFGGAAWYLGREAHGDRVRLNQVEIVDIDAQEQIVRGTVWTHLYSPTAARFEVVSQIDASDAICRDPQGLIAWQGLPGGSLGGLGSRQVALAEADAYRIHPPGTQPSIAGLAVQNASSKSLSVRWWGPPAFATPSQLVRTEHGPVEGELTNPFPFELTECLLVYGDWLYRLGTIGGGQTITVDPRESLSLEYRLTERTVLDSKDISTPWDQATTDIPRIVRIMMFHEAARGRSYTGLTHRYQSYIDLTPQVRLGRAVLAGRASGQVTRLGSAGEPLAAEEDQSVVTWCRIVFPVQPYAPRGRESLAEGDSP